MVFVKVIIVAYYDRITLNVLKRYLIHINRHLANEVHLRDRFQ